MVAKHDNSYPFFILRSLDLEAGIKATTRLKFKSKSLIHGFGNCSFLPLLKQPLEQRILQKCLKSLQFPNLYDAKLGNSSNIPFIIDYNNFDRLDNGNCF